MIRSRVALHTAFHCEGQTVLGSDVHLARFLTVITDCVLAVISAAIPFLNIGQGSEVFGLCRVPLCLAFIFLR